MISRYLRDRVSHPNKPDSPGNCGFCSILKRKNPNPQDLRQTQTGSCRILSFPGKPRPDGLENRGSCMIPKRMTLDTQYLK
jgi:hypothetical protein